MKRTVKAWAVMSKKTGKFRAPDGMIITELTRKGAEYTATFWAGSCVIPCTITYDDGKKEKP
jgi:hypothetical protein